MPSGNPKKPINPPRDPRQNEDGQEETPGRNRWRRTPPREAGRGRVERAVTPSTPEMFDFEDLDEEIEKEKKIGKFDIGTPGS